MSVRKVRHGTQVWNAVVIFFVLATAGVSLVVSELGIERAEQELRYVLLIPFYIIGVGLLYGTYYLLDLLYTQYFLSTRKRALVQKARQKGMTPVGFLPVGSALASIIKGAPRNNVAYWMDDWGYTDFQYVSYGEDLTDKMYKKHTVHFSVGVFQLPRVMPHVFFDSLNSGKREFRLLFLAEQAYDFEGDFPNYFKTFIVQDYARDILKIITPDVMEAFVACQEYDIEIFGDRLYLIRELEKMPEQLQDVEKKERPYAWHLQKTYYGTQTSELEENTPATPLVQVGLNFENRSPDKNLCCGWLFCLQF